MWQTYFVSSVVVCLALVAVPVPPNEEQAKKNKEFYRRRSRLAERSIGVLLQASVTVDSKPGMPDEILIHWKIDYNGRRVPLIIAEPSLDRKVYPQTQVNFYAETTEGHRHEFRLKYPGPVLLAWDVVGKVITIQKDQTGTGTLTVPVSEVRSYFRERWPKAFGNAAPVLYLQLIHEPWSRQSDAWTGELLTPVIRVPLKKW